MEPLVPTIGTEPSYQPGKHRPKGIRTEILLSGAAPLLVMETTGYILGQIERTDIEWPVVRLDEDTAVHIRSSSVVALIDLTPPSAHLKAA